MSILDKRDLNRELALIKIFLALQGKFVLGIGNVFLGWMGVIKDISTKLMYRQRGRFSQSHQNHQSKVRYRDDPE